MSPNIIVILLHFPDISFFVSPIPPYVGHGHLLGYMLRSARLPVKMDGSHSLIAMLTEKVLGS